jgi:hypothetical protein
VILIFNCIDFTPLSYGDYLLPDWAQGLGWLMALTSLIAMPICALSKYILSFRDESFDGLTAMQVSALAERLITVLCSSSVLFTAAAQTDETKSSVDQKEAPLRRNHPG